jgi:hypothetical protein
LLAGQRFQLIQVGSRGAARDNVEISSIRHVHFFVGGLTLGTCTAGGICAKCAPVR